jgi:Transglycosylase SLT domain
MRVDSPAREAMLQAVSRAAQATGVDFSLLLETAKRESGLDKNAKAKTSSAAGLFQFIDSTWLSMIEKYGSKHGVSGDVKNPAQRQALLDLRYDPDIAGRMAGELARENASALEQKLGRAASVGEIYAAHVLGAEGASKLLAAPGANASALLPQAAAANRGIFYAEGAPLTAAGVLAKLQLAAREGAPAPAAPAAQNLRLGPDPTAALSEALAGALNGVSGLSALGGLGQDLWAIAMRAYRRPE